MDATPLQQGATPWQLAQRVQTPEGAALQWQLRRNCCLTPRQLMAAGLVTVAFNGVVGVVFWVLGYPVIGAFAALESGVVVACLVAYARHACDRETITLQQGRLAVESHCGLRVQRTELHAGWVRVEPACRPGDLVGLRERGISVQVGRHVPPWLREQVARELRRALVAA